MSIELKDWTLRQRSYLITGGTKGIGLGVAKSVCAHGAACVIICSRNEDECRSVASDLGKEYPCTKVVGVGCDVSSEEGRGKLIAAVTACCDGRLDGLVNNVGVNVRKDIVEQTAEEYNLMMRTNVDAAYFLCKGLKDSLAKAAEERGSAAVVNVTSAAGVSSTGTGAVYGMCKAAMIQLSKILACEWAKLNVRVNSVAPWMTMTPMLQDAIKNDPSQLDKVKEWTPMHRLPTVEEVAGPITYFLMPSSRFVTGQLISVDGGLSAQAFDGPCVTTP